MSVLVGHPTGNPVSHHSALAYFEAGLLESFCVPWMPSQTALQAIGSMPGLRSSANRLARRHFPPLEAAPKIQGRIGEFRRLVIRGMGLDDERLPNEANDWLMRTMSRESRRPGVTAIHSYEDCSLWQFQAAKPRGQACLYDMPTTYYPAWERIRNELTRKYAAWIPSSAMPIDRYMRPQQKREEMVLADIVLAPSRFVEGTIRDYFPDKSIALTPYGVDLEFWTPRTGAVADRPLRFIYAGQISLRKGIPFLIEAWRDAHLRDAELVMVGSWQLADRRLKELPANVLWYPPCSSEDLREHYRSADVFVFPSYCDGYGLVLVEAMACGLPAICSDATAGPDIMNRDTGHIMPAGDHEALMAALQWFVANRDLLPSMKRAARAQAEHCTWPRFRASLIEAVRPYV